jgi:hypothetical protein
MKRKPSADHPWYRGYQAPRSQSLTDRQARELNALTKGGKTPDTQINVPEGRTRVGKTKRPALRNNTNVKK